MIKKKKENLRAIKEMGPIYYIRNTGNRRTSNDVPFRSKRSGSAHIVGTGMGRGKRRMYSVHGVGERPFGRLDWANWETK